MNAQEIVAAKEVLDLVIRHQISLHRYSNGQVRRMMAILNKADADIFAALTIALERLPAGVGTVEYLESMLGSVRSLNAQAYQAIEGSLTAGMRDLAGTEASFQYELYKGAVTADVNLAAISAEQAWQAVYSRPFAGKMLREVVKELGETRAKRIRDAVRMGYLEGKPTAKIVSDIRGTRAKGYVEGFVEVDRRNLETIVRTALSHTAAGARKRFFEENGDVVESQLWLSTLDSRTSEICIARSGKRYTVDERPKPIGHSVPWCTPMGCGPGNAHWNAVVAGTMVLTSSGYRAIESIRTGDLVVTHAGALKPVLDVRSKTNESDVVRVVHTHAGRTLRATHEHPVWTTAGWKFVGALEIGDELLCDLEDEGEVFLGVQAISPESQDGPAVGDESRVALLRSLHLGASAVRLESDLDVRASEVEDRCVRLVLGDPALSALDESGKHHLFATAHALQKLGRDRLADLLSDVQGDRSAPPKIAERSVVALLAIRFNNALGNARHAARVVLGHAARMLCMCLGGFLGQTPSPMIFAGRRNAVAGSELDTNLSGLVPHGKARALGPMREAPVSQTDLPLDLPKGLAVGDVLAGQKGAVVREWFGHDAVVSLEVQHYKSTVFDLEVQGDASYVASGIVVSNCRSTALALLPGQTKLFGTRASKDGQVDANMSYGEWLKTQPASVQDEALGPTRGKLFRDGGLTIDKFQNDKGLWLDIDQLRAKDAAAFKRAGV
jgi:hypothetical protein